MSFQSSFPPEVGSLNGLSGNLTLAAGTNVTITPSGNTLTISATAGGGGANQDLSNLTNPTAVNQSLLPSIDNSKSLGTNAKRWTDARFVNNVDAASFNVLQGGAGNSLKFTLGTNGAFPDGSGSGAGYIVSAAGVPFLVSTTTVSSGTGDRIGIETANVTGTADSGGITISSGDAQTGASGFAQIRSGSVLNSTATSNTAQAQIIGGDNNGLGRAGDVNIVAGTIINAGNTNDGAFVTIDGGEIDAGSGKGGQVLISGGHTKVIATGDAGDVLIVGGDSDLANAGKTIIKGGVAFSSGFQDGSIQIGDSQGTSAAGVNSGRVDVTTKDTLDGQTGSLNLSTGDSDTGTAADINIDGGWTGNNSAVTAASAANINLTAGFVQSNGASPSTGNAGNISITAGENRGEGTAGAIVITSGAISNSASIQDSGAITIQGAVNAGSGTAGPVFINGGASNGATGNGGQLTFTAGISNGSGVGGSVGITAGDGGGGGGGVSIVAGNSASQAGDIALQAGVGGTNGNIILQAENITVANITGFGVGFPTWKKFTLGHAAFNAASTTNDVELFQLPAKGAIHSVIISQSAAFTGGGSTAYTISVGISTSLAKYAGPFNVFQAPGDSIGQASNVFDFENKTAATSIRANAISTGANLNAVTTGSVDIWVLVSLFT